MENYDKICLNLIQTTCKKETHLIATRAMNKYGEFKHVLIQTKRRIINGTRNHN